MPTPINTSLDQLYTVDELAALSSPATSDLLVLARGGLGKSLSYQSLLDDLFDRLAADWLVQGTGVTLSYNTSTNKMTVSASGGAGTTDHAALSNLGWTVSGHTGTASRLAGWDSGGTATTYVIGTGSGQIAAGDHTHSTYTLSSVVPSTAPTAGQVLAGNAGGTAYAPVTLSGSGATISLASTGVLTISSIANASLTNSSVTVTAGTGLSGGGAVALGGSVSLSVSYGTTSGTACQGNDARLSDSRAASSVSTSTTTAISGLLKGATTLAAATAGTDYVAPNGALGTPASGTLTNCTGLPPAGLTFSATDRLAGRSTSGGGAGEEIACTAAGRALIGSSQYLGLILGTESDPTGSSATVQMVKGELTPIDLGGGASAGPTANVSVLFPASPTHGDRCGFVITRQSGRTSATFATAPAYCAEVDNGTTLVQPGTSNTTYSCTDNGTGGSAKYGLWLTGERLIFRYQDGGAGAGWFVEVDGRIPHACSLFGTETSAGSAKSQDNSSSGNFKVVGNAFFQLVLNNSDYDNAGIGSATNSNGLVKRAAQYHFDLHASIAAGGTSAGTPVITSIGTGGTTELRRMFRGPTESTNYGGGANSMKITMAAAAGWSAMAFIAATTTGASIFAGTSSDSTNPRLTVTEILR